MGMGFILSIHNYSALEALIHNDASNLVKPMTFPYFPTIVHPNKLFSCDFRLKSDAFAFIASDKHLNIIKTLQGVLERMKSIFTSFIT